MYKCIAAVFAKTELQLFDARQIKQKNMTDSSAKITLLF